VEFDAPEGCSSATTFLKTLRSRTDRVREAEGDEPRTTLHVRLVRARGNVVGELRMEDEQGATDTRRVQGANCDEVVQALSLTAALALDPSALLSGTGGSLDPNGTAIQGDTAKADSTSTDQAAQPPVKPEASERKPPAEAGKKPGTDEAGSRENRPLPSLELHAGPVGSAILEGSGSPGLMASVRKYLGGDGVFRPGLGLAVFYFRNDVLDTPDTAQASLAGLAATACPLRVPAGIMTFQPCTSLLAGRLSVSGRQVVHTSTAAELWLSVVASVRAAAYLGHGFSLELEGGIDMPLIKRRFFTTVPNHVVAETPSISPILALGLSLGL
jgi:hypothetical protein